MKIQQNSWHYKLYKKLSKQEDVPKKIGDYYEFFLSEFLALILLVLLTGTTILTLYGFVNKIEFTGFFQLISIITGLGIVFCVFYGLLCYKVIPRIQKHLNTTIELE